MRPRSLVIPIAGVLTLGVILASAQASASSATTRSAAVVSAAQARDRDDDTRTVAARAAAEHRDDPKPAAATNRPTAHPFTLSSECQAAIGAVRTLVQDDPAEDRAEAANPPANDAAEDQAEIAALKAAIQAAISACLPARISTCATAVNSLNAIWLRNTIETHIDGSRLAGAALQLQERLNSTELAAARDAVMRACVTSR